VQQRSERKYYEQRALDAVARAKAACDPKIASIHLELFHSYLDRIANLSWRRPTSGRP
jgi:hypothetical protein